MRLRLQSLTQWLAAAAVVAFGMACVASYRPSGATDRLRAVETLKRALAALNDQALDSKDRLVAYRGELREADRLLVRALRSNPTDTVSIERLATVRWEAGVLAGFPDRAPILALVVIAASRAPRVPEIQVELGALLYRMGNPEDGAPFMERALALSPTMTTRVVTAMQDAGVEPVRILNTFARTPEIMIALREGFDRSDRTSDWLLSAEQLLPEYPRQLLPAYVNACWKAKDPRRLLSQVEQLGVLQDQRAEAERQIAIGWAQVGRNVPHLAVLAAKSARSLSDGGAALLERAGQVALAAGDAEEAESAFRDALGAYARANGRGTDLARCYRERGQALERLGRAEEAFDQYRRAIEILPDDPWLRRRFTSWTPNPLPEDHP